jgi:hypothetical protein
MSASYLTADQLRRADLSLLSACAFAEAFSAALIFFVSDLMRLSPFNLRWSQATSRNRSRIRMRNAESSSIPSHSALLVHGRNAAKYRITV